MDDPYLVNQFFEHKAQADKFKSTIEIQDITVTTVVLGLLQVVWAYERLFQTLNHENVASVSTFILLHANYKCYLVGNSPVFLNHSINKK